MTRRDLGDGFELDDDKQRVDLVEVHRYLCDESYWAAGRPFDVQERLVRDAARIVGLYQGERQIGFCRAYTDDVSFAYLADVYVLTEFRGRGFGEELVREMVDNGPFATNRWLLHTTEHAPALPQVRLLRAGLQVAGEASHEPGERQRIALRRADRAGPRRARSGAARRTRPASTRARWSAVAPRSRKYSSALPASSQMLLSSHADSHCSDAIRTGIVLKPPLPHVGNDRRVVDRKGSSPSLIRERRREHLDEQDIVVSSVSAAKLSQNRAGDPS